MECGIYKCTVDKGNVVQSAVKNLCGDYGGIVHGNIPHVRVYQLKGNGQGVFGIVGNGNILQKGTDQANTLGE